ncbi:MAG: tetratricopeptide repeat protein [Verrucomicrobiota bacterium]|nr:tetratricopeptide repeat protein [Verrucomicrobiota bacterium]
MNDLPQPEKFRLDAAEGWLLLGNPIEANEELEAITSEHRFHPLVLAMRWQVYAAANWWEAAWVVAQALCDLCPHSAEAWICHANTARKVRGLMEAWEILTRVADRFPSEPIVIYNLACYSAQLGWIDMACSRLVQAFEMPNSDPLKVAAVHDPDLRPLWDKIMRGAPYGLLALSND